MTPYHRGMRRLLASALVVVLVAPAAAVAKNGGSLLSGYGGPGDGEQALLGGQLVVKGSGSSRAPSANAIYARGAPAVQGGSASAGSSVSPASIRACAWRAARATESGHSGATLYGSVCRGRTSRTEPGEALP